MPLEPKSTEQGRRRLTALLVAFAAAWCIYWFVHAWSYWEDDAYIHLEFARSVAAGRGFAFNGRVVAGDTAPLWVLLLAGMHALIPDWIVAGKVLTVFGAAFGLAGTYAFARSLARSILPRASAEIFPAAVVLLVVVNPFTCYWIFSGMESLAAAGLACFAVLAATRDVPTTKSFLTGCLLAGIAPLVRPEMIVLTALVALPLLGQWLRLNSQKRAGFGAFAAGLLLIALPLTLWSLYSLHAFGHVLPNTNAAKRAAPTDSVVRHLVGIYALGFPLILCGLLAGIASLLLRASEVRSSIRNALASVFAPLEARGFPLAGWIFILWPLINTVFYIANHTYVQTRYILVTAPGLTVVIMALALEASQRAGRAVYVAAMLAAITVSVVIVRPFIRNKGINCQVSRDLALYIRDHVAPDAPVADYSIGEIAFVSEHPIIDTGGITRPGAIPYLNAPPEAMLRWARSEGARYYIGEPPESNATLEFSAEQRFIGWSFHTANYGTTVPIELWKLAPDPPQQAESPASTHPNNH
jgi:hypothetical protein